MHSVATLLSGDQGVDPTYLGACRRGSSYSQMDRASIQRINLTEGIDSTLVMLGHKLLRRHRRAQYATDVP